MTFATKQALNQIVKSNTTTVNYRGKNNQSYSKLCEPNRNQIFIGNISQMYIPEYSVNFDLARRDQTISFVHNGKPDVFVYSDSTNNCGYCGLHIQGKRQLCLECGTISCSKKTFFKTKSHTLSCEMCGKTICPDCAGYVSKMIILKTIVCSDCGTNLRKQGKTIKKLRIGH